MFAPYPILERYKTSFIPLSREVSFSRFELPTYGKCVLNMIGASFPYLINALLQFHHQQLVINFTNKVSVCT